MRLLSTYEEQEILDNIPDLIQNEIDDKNYEIESLQDENNDLTIENKELRDKIHSLEAALYYKDDMAKDLQKLINKYKVVKRYFGGVLPYGYHD